MVDGSLTRPVLLNASLNKASPNYLPTVHGKATDTIASMGGKKFEINKLNDTSTINFEDVTFTVSGTKNKSMGISTHKLLSVLTNLFTSLNHTGATAKKINTYKVSISLVDYALKCGNDKVLVKETDNPEDEKIEAERAKNALKNVRKKVVKDLDLLFNASVSWSENVKGKDKDFMDVRLISAKGIKNGIIAVEFTPTYADYLVKLPITQYPTPLLSIDERKPNAYKIGLAMTEHYCMYPNHTRSTQERLKVSTLLKKTDLPSISDASVKKNNWIDRIKEPLENSLDVLTKSGVLIDWKYCKSKGVELTDTEADFKSYEEWSKTLIEFKLKNPPNIEPKTKEITEAHKKKTKAKKHNK